MPKEELDLSPASNDPDDMVSGGLPSGFWGAITEARYVPWNYKGKVGKYTLAVRLTIEPDEDSGIDSIEPVYYSCGSLATHFPSMDGKTLAGDVDADTYMAMAKGQAQVDDEDFDQMEGIYALGVKEAQLNKNSNWAEFNKHLKTAGFSEISPVLTYIEGVEGYFVRVPQPERDFRNGQGAKEGETRDILIIAELRQAKASKSKAKTKPKAAKPAADDEAGDIGAQIDSAVLEILIKNDGELPRVSMMKTIMEQFSDQKPAVMKHFRGKEAGDGWALSEDKFTVA